MLDRNSKLGFFGESLFSEKRGLSNEKTKKGGGQNGEN